MTDGKGKFEILGMGAVDAGALKHTADITTARFRLAPSVHARMAIMRRAGRSWLAVALPVAALVIGGMFYDTRLLFIAAVFMFILFPTLLFIGWYSILTRPWAVASQYPQRVTLGVGDEITVEYFPLPCEDAIRGTEEPLCPPREMIIPARDISDCRMWGDNVVVLYSGSRELIIPFSAFGSQQQASDFISRLARTER